VYLHKYTHPRQPDGDHAGATAAGERRAQPPHPANAHDWLRAGEDALVGDDATIITLSAREREMLAGLGTKLEQWLENPARIAASDWEALAPIALRLRDLLRRIHE
jgi:hypothetical protein